MKQSVNFSAFVDAFHAFVPDRYDQFGYSALRVIFDYLEDLEDSMGQEIELDVLAICCDYNVDTWENIAKNYNIDLNPDDDAVDQACTVIEYLQDNTIYLGETDDGQFVYQVF